MSVASLGHGRQVFLGLKTCWVLACTLIVSTLDTVDNSVPASPADHSSWASTQSSLPTAYILSIPGDLCESNSVSLLASGLGITILVPFKIKSILNCHFFPKCAECLYFTWEFFYVTWPPLLYSIFEYGKVSSACVASHNCCKLSLLSLSWLVIWYTQLGQLDGILKSPYSGQAV